MPAKTNGGLESGDVAGLRERLQDAEETLRALGAGEADALVIETEDGPRIYTLESAEAASNRFRGEVLAQISDAVIATDANDRVTFVNAAAERLYGIAANEVLGSGLSDIYEVRGVQPGNGEWHGEQIHISRKGERLHVDVSVTMLRYRTGLPGGRLLVVRDISARVAADAALRESQERLRLIVENAREYAIVSLDLQRCVTSWNSGAAQMLGYAEREILGRKGDVIFTTEDRASGAPEQEARLALAEGRATDERWHLRKDGNRFWGSGVMMAMLDANGEPVGFVKIFRDQTGVREAREALEEGREQLWEALQEAERARAEAEAAGRAKDHFLAVLSHELRTPLTPVLMAVHTLMRRADLPLPVSEALAMIRRNVQVEAHFIDDLLDITRIARGKLEIVCEPMDLHRAVIHAVEISQPDIDLKKQRLSVALNATKHQLLGDPMRLQQLFWNLLKNASKFTPTGGGIRIISRNVPGRCVVEVSDDGIGFDPHHAIRIFDPFTQATDAISREFGGLGLGLAISKATADAHRGTLQGVSAGLAQGATFIVDLPLTTTSD